MENDQTLSGPAKNKFDDTLVPEGLLQRLSKLPDPQGAAVRMRFVDRRSLRQIAAALESSPEAVASMLLQGLARLEDEE